MTFKPNDFESSQVMRSLEKLAQEKGLIKNDPLKRIAATKKPIDFKPSESLMENIVKLTAGLRQSGLNKYADELESRFMNYKKADSSLYETSKEEGEDLVDAAHPQGSHTIEGILGDNVVETIVDQHLKMLKIISKQPNGKLANSKEVLKAVKVVLGQQPVAPMLETKEESEAPRLAVGTIKMVVQNAVSIANHAVTIMEDACKAIDAKIQWRPLDDGNIASQKKDIVEAKGIVDSGAITIEGTRSIIDLIKGIKEGVLRHFAGVGLGLSLKKGDQDATKEYYDGKNTFTYKIDSAIHVAQAGAYLFKGNEGLDGARAELAAGGADKNIPLPDTMYVSKNNKPMYPKKDDKGNIIKDEKGNVVWVEGNNVPAAGGTPGTTPASGTTPVSGETKSKIDTFKENSNTIKGELELFGDKVNGSNKIDADMKPKISEWIKQKTDEATAMEDRFNKPFTTEDLRQRTIKYYMRRINETREDITRLTESWELGSE